LEFAPGRRELWLDPGGGNQTDIKILEIFRIVSQSFEGNEIVRGESLAMPGLSEKSVGNGQWASMGILKLRLAPLR